MRVVRSITLFCRQTHGDGSGRETKTDGLYQCVTVCACVCLCINVRFCQHVCVHISATIQILQEYFVALADYSLQEGGSSAAWQLLCRGFKVAG